MSNPYGAFGGDFYVNMRLGSQLPLPRQRETVLHFMESVQKQFPTMTRFRKSDNKDLNLEEDRNNASYRWVSLEAKRMSAGHVNPADVGEAMTLHTALLEMAPYHLGISPVEIDYLDILFGFDLNFTGNHDEIIAESLLVDSPLMAFADEAGARPVDVQPSITLSLSDDCRLQARIDVVTRTTSYQVRTGDYNDDAISIYLVIRRYWGDRPKESLAAMAASLADRADELCSRYVVPRIVRSVSEAISSRS